MLVFYLIGNTSKVTFTLLSSIKTIRWIIGHLRLRVPLGFCLHSIRQKDVSFRERVAFRQKIVSLCYRYGVQLILEDRPKEVKEYTPAVLVIVFFGVLSGAQNMGLTSPHLEAFAVARGSAAAIFQVLDRVPTIDSLSKEGRRLESVNGEIEFKNVEFRYPARKDVQVLRGLNLRVNRGETVALVGGSGCGKSTCLQLIQRLYDPLSGQVSEYTRYKIVFHRDKKIHYLELFISI